MSRYRPKESHISKDPLKRQRQLNNLMQGRKRQASRPLDSSTPTQTLRGPFHNYEGNIIAYLQDHFYIPETKAPVVLEPWQVEQIFDPLFEVDPETGLRRYSLGLVGLPKKNGKSQMAAMVANYELFQGPDFGEVIIASNSREQSSWVVFSKLSQSVRMNKEQLRFLRVTDDFIENKKTGTVARIVAPNYKTGSGANPSLTLFDELWGYEDTPGQSARKFFDELTTVPTRAEPLTVIFSYSGYDEDSLLFELYKKGLEGDDPKMFFLWSHDNLASWISEEYLTTQRKRLRANTYLRLHENRWTSGESQFIDMELWDRCVDHEHRPLLLRGGKDRGIKLVVAVDVGIYHDTAAVVGLYEDAGKVKVGIHRKWQPSKANPLDLEETIEAYVEELQRCFTVKVVLYDPYQFHRSAVTLAKKGVNMEEFPQTLDRLTAMSQNLYDIIKGGNITLYRDDDLRSHALKCRAKEYPRGWRIVKEKSSHKIDLIIAMAMASLGLVKEPTGLSVAEALMKGGMGPVNPALVDSVTVRSRFNIF